MGTAVTVSEGKEIPFDYTWWIEEEKRKYKDWICNLKFKHEIDMDCPYGKCRFRNKFCEL